MGAPQSECAGQDVVVVLRGLSALLGLQLSSGHDLPRNLGSVLRPREEVNWSLINAHFPDLQLRQFIDLQGCVTFIRNSELMSCTQQLRCVCAFNFPNGCRGALHS
jgi:hypothetical protein